jgi:hypothetical protein
VIFLTGFFVFDRIYRITGFTFSFLDRITGFRGFCFLGDLFFYFLTTKLIIYGVSGFD